MANNIASLVLLAIPGGRGSITCRTGTLYMWNEATSIIKPEFNPEEHLLWSDQPRQGIMFKANDILMIPFSLMWGGFAIFWESSALRSNDPIAKLWGILFVLVGLHVIIGRFFVEAWKRKRIFYGVTSKLIVIVSNFFSRRVISLSLRTVSDIILSQKSDGSGTIIFGPAVRKSRWSWGRSWGGEQEEPPSFDEIQDAKKVYEIIGAAQRQAQ